MTMPLVDLASKTFARAQSSGVPFKELSRVKLRRLTREHISKNISKSSKIHNYTRRAHILRDVSNTFRERTCKYESKRKSYESSERRFNYISHRLKNLQSRKSTRSNRKTRCVQRSQSLDKLGRSRVCCDV